MSEREQGQRIASVLRVIADYYGGCQDGFTEEEVTVRKEATHQRLLGLGDDSYRFAEMIYNEAIRYAPEVWPDIESERVW